MSEDIYQIITRAEAKEQGLKFYFTGKPCKRGHISPKYVNGGCAQCKKEYDKEYATADVSKARLQRYRTTDAYREAFKTYNNSDKGKECQQKHRKTDKHRQSAKDYRTTDKYKEGRRNHQRIYQKNNRTTDPLYKLRGDIRSLIGKSMRKRGFKKSSKTATILGCSFEEFKIHIESQFTEGMNWDNSGLWHYDHIYPISKARDEAHLIELNHYTNFQPLWAADNIKKSNKLI